MSAADNLNFEFLSAELVDVTAHQPFAYCGDEFGLECNLSFKLFSIHSGFMSGQMILFSMSDGGGRVSVRCKIMKLCSSIVCTQRHVVLLASWTRTLIVVRG